MLPNTTQIADQDSSQDQLENEQQPLIQPQNTHPRFLSSTLDFFQQLYHSVIAPRVPSSPITAETTRSAMIFRGWYPSKTPNSTTAPSLESAERTGKRLREAESPSALRHGIIEQEAKSENCDTRPHKRLKEVGSITRIAEQETTAPFTSWNTDQINTNQVFESFTSTAPRPMVAHVTTHQVTSLQGAHDFTIRDNAHITNVGVSNVNNVNNYGRTFDLDVMERFMEKYVSLNAIHDSSVQDPDRKCHPETRLSVLRQIHGWADNPDGNESIFWLHGPAGVGKSAIAQTIARSYSRQKVAATFFFYKSDPSRNDGNKLFTTIAWQLALLIPAIKAHIINSLNERPDLPRKDIETQFQELIVRPLVSVSSQTQLFSLIIIIDGVDECVDEKLQRRFLKVIGNAVNEPNFPLRFLICSRPEAHIEEAVDSFQCTPLRLDLAKLDDANHDIEKYLRAEFSRIASEQDLDPSWPDDEKIRKCVYKSSGHFIYASTLVKLVDDEYNSAPTQLDIVLGLKPHGGKSLFAELDALYMEILERQRDCAFINDILSLLTAYHMSSSVPYINGCAILMDIPEKELCRKLRGMRSLLKLDRRFDVHHRSFVDFLQDSSRSGQYHISERAGARRYLDLITASIVRHVPIVFEQPDCHQKHFVLPIRLPGVNILSVEEVQQALQPLVHIQAKLLTIESVSWQQVRQCNKCNILSIIWNLVLYLTCHKETSKHKAAHPTYEITPVVPEEQGPSGTLGSPTSFVATKVEQVILENSRLDVSLSSVLIHLRETKLESPPSAMTIDLMCSLLNFDCVEIAMRVRSISDGQLLVDAIDYLINNEEFLRQHSTTIARGAARLALQVHARVPVLPRSLFCPDGLSQHLILKDHFSETWFTSMFMGRILDRNCVLRISCVFKEGRLKIVHDSVNSYESIKEWRRSNPSSVMMLRVMLEVAKVVQYFDSMDVLLGTNLNIIYLDLEGHVKIFPWGSFCPSTHRPSEEVRHLNISRLGTTFYELYFDVEYRHHFKDSMLQDPERPSEPEISEELWQVITRCCGEDPPTVNEVVQEMESWKID